MEGVRLGHLPKACYHDSKEGSWAFRYALPEHPTSCLVTDNSSSIDQIVGPLCISEFLFFAVRASFIIYCEIFLLPRSLTFALYHGSLIAHGFRMTLSRYYAIYFETRVQEVCK